MDKSTVPKMLLLQRVHKTIQHFEMLHLFHSRLRMERSNICNQNQHSASDSMHMKQRQGGGGKKNTEDKTYF